MEVHSGDVAHVVLLRQGDGLVHRGAAVEDVARQNGVGDGELAGFLLVDGGLAVLNVQLQDGDGQALFIQAVHAEVGEHRDQRGVGCTVVQHPGVVFAARHRQPARVGDANGLVLALRRAVQRHVQAGVRAAGIVVPVIVVPGGEEALAGLVPGGEGGAARVKRAELGQDRGEHGVVVVVIAVHLVEDAVRIHALQGIQRGGDVRGQPFGGVGVGLRIGGAHQARQGDGEGKEDSQGFLHKYHPFCVFVS